ncbi:MAG: GNAT family N-acetyltransferase [Bacteroidales bacterium]|nr:GNAT family N-acetyltransferase [Bacteroidales bacterium]
MIQTLTWDSAFFGLRIGRTDIWEMADWQVLQQDFAAGRFDLLYVFSHIPVQAPLPQAKRVDTKVIYRKMLTTAPAPVDSHVQAFADKVPDEALLRLALVSGQYSRYRTDGQFPAGSYERLYRRWMENSTNGQLADVVLCYKRGKEKQGVITLRLENGVGSIGLIAVDVTEQGRGIGTALIGAAEEWLRKKGAQAFEVITQQENASARRFYEKRGFVQVSATDIYHLWAVSSGHENGEGL